MAFLFASKVAGVLVFENRSECLRKGKLEVLIETGIQTMKAVRFKITFNFAAKLLKAGFF